MMRFTGRPAVRFASVVAALGIALSTTNAQAPGSPQTALFRANATLVLVPVSVVDRRGAFVRGLPRDAFGISQDGVRQQIQSFSQEDSPASMGIVLDLSGSMRMALGNAKEAVRMLVDASNPEDEAFLNGVSTQPRKYFGFTRNLDEIVSRIGFEQAGGDTALIDTIFDSLAQVRGGVHSRKALIVISDGMDNHSRHSSRELLDRAMETDALIYTIAIRREEARYAKPMTLRDDHRGTMLMGELAARTGGLSFTVGDQSDLKPVTLSIARSLRNLYTIGYAPRDTGERGRWRRIKVTVAGAGMKAYARPGYRLD